MNRWVVSVQPPEEINHEGHEEHKNTIFFFVRCVHCVRFVRFVVKKMVAG
jgi:hypothetical protein